MASPQKENGYVPIANELFEALCAIRISGEVRQIIDTVFRKTYGFNKKQDAISLSQFCISTRLRKCDVCRAINKAISMNILKVISKKANGDTNIYSINKDFDSWKPLAKKQRGVAKKQIIISKIANNRLQKSNIQKTVSKDTITKDISEPSSEVAEFINLFKEINPAYQYLFGRPNQRDASKRLLKIRNLEEWIKVMAFVLMRRSDRFCPRISTPIQLEQKYADLQTYATGLKHKGDEVKNKYKVAF